MDGWRPAVPTWQGGGTVVGALVPAGEGREVQEQLPAQGGTHALGMELHPIPRQAGVGQGHEHGLLLCCIRLGELWQPLRLHSPRTPRMGSMHMAMSDPVSHMAPRFWVWMDGVTWP